MSVFWTWFAFDPRLSLSGGIRINSYLRSFTLSNYRQKSQVKTTRASTRLELQKALKECDLTREEELVIRMRQGVSVSPTEMLEFRGQDNVELSAELAAIESDALQHMTPRLVAESGEGSELKDAIVDRLKQL